MKPAKHVFPYPYSWTPIFRYASDPEPCEYELHFTRDIVLTVVVIGKGFDMVCPAFHVDETLQAKDVESAKQEAIDAFKDRLNRRKAGIENMLTLLEKIFP